MKKKSSILFLLRIVKMLVGIINLSLTAKYFGVSIDKDIWLLAIATILFVDSVIWGPINETFRVKFIFLRGENGEIDAIGKTRSLIFFTLLLSLLSVMLLILFPHFLVQFIAPAYQGKELSALLRMIVLIAPVLLLNQLIALGRGLLNAYESFIVPEISGFITSIFALVLLVVLAPTVGIYSLVISFYVGQLFLLGMILFYIFKLKIKVFTGYSNIKFSDFYLFVVFSIPFFLPYFFGQISNVLEKTLASSIGVGYVSILDYSRKFTDILTGVLTSVLITILVPVLSEKFINKKPKEFAYNFNQLYQLGLLFMTFVIALFTSSSYAFVSFFYDKGPITKEVLAEISRLTILYSWSALAVFIYIIFGMSLLSSGKVKKYAFWGVAAQVLSILLIVIFIKSVGVYIFPVALFASHLFAGGIMFNQFPYKSKQLYNITYKYLSVLFITSLVSLIFDFYLIEFSKPLLTIICNSLFIAFVLLIMIYLFKLEERKHVTKILKINA